MRFPKDAVKKMADIALKKYGKKVTYREEGAALDYSPTKQVCEFDDGLSIDEREGIYFRNNLMFNSRKNLYVIGTWEKSLQIVCEHAIMGDDAHNVEHRWRHYGLSNYHNNGLMITVGRHFGDMIARDEQNDVVFLDVRNGICYRTEGLKKLLQIINDHRDCYRRKKFPEFFDQSSKGLYCTRDEVERMAWNVVKTIGYNKTRMDYGFCDEEIETITSRNVEYGDLAISFVGGIKEGDLNISVDGNLVFQSQKLYDVTCSKEDPNRDSFTRFEPDCMVYAPIFVKGEWEQMLKELDHKVSVGCADNEVKEEKDRKKKIKVFSDNCLKYLGKGFGNYTIVNKSNNGEPDIEIYEFYFSSTGGFKVPDKRLLFRTSDPFFYEDAYWYKQFIEEIKRRRY